MEVSEHQMDICPFSGDTCKGGVCPLFGYKGQRCLLSKLCTSSIQNSGNTLTIERQLQEIIDILRGGNKHANKTTNRY
jgi:hypothetical protein